MLLHHAAWPEVEAYLKHCKGIIIPIGSTEQHGPNGLVGTDAICPEVIAAEAGADSGFLVGPTFNVGIAQHHLGFPGSMTLRPSTMIAALNDWIESLTRHGIDRIYFLNGHGGNIATIQAAFAEFYANFSLDAAPCPVQLKSRNWWELPGVMDLARELFPVGEGQHATASEVSVTYYAHPSAIKSVAMSPKIAPVGGFTDAADYRRNFPDGRIGSDPSQATPEKGERLVSTAKRALIGELTQFFGAPPRRAAAE
ncbi:creatininase family protein [Maricaulis parjimensis]|uniref:creatininase family protein n=1 Tax=Maricaulis parjimensis TaxID=144023 RepID=UPI00193A0B12|nr:creatininase family protein [Maricaulis parjimensis]